MVEAKSSPRTNPISYLKLLVYDNIRQNHSIVISYIYYKYFFLQKKGIIVKYFDVTL